MKDHIDHTIDEIKTVKNNLFTNSNENISDS